MRRETVRIPTLSPDSWNALVDRLSRRLPLRCVRTSRKWQHPWSIAPEWDEAAGWVLRMTPGFVNGVDPEVDVPASLAGKRTLDRIEAETGKRPEKEQPVTGWLTEAPRIACNFTRIIGKGSNPEAVSVNDAGIPVFQFEGVPEFFYPFGVTPEEVVFTGNLNSGIQLVETDVTKEKESPPILRAVDVVLYVDRFAAKVDILRGSDTGDSYTALYFQTFGRTTPAKERPWLRTQAKYAPRAAVDIGDFLQEASEMETDAVKIATIYLLSPKGTAAEAEPDATWIPFVKHAHFWNLAHAPAFLPDTRQFEPLRIRTGLIGGGLADQIFARLLAPLNEGLSVATALALQKDFSGRFWSV